MENEAQPGHRIEAVLAPLALPRRKRNVTSRGSLECNYTAKGNQVSPLSAFFLGVYLAEGGVAFVRTDAKPLIDKPSTLEFVRFSGASGGEQDEYERCCCSCAALAAGSQSKSLGIIQMLILLCGRKAITALPISLGRRQRRFCFVRASEVPSDRRTTLLMMTMGRLPIWAYNVKISIPRLPKPHSFPPRHVYTVISHGL